MFSFVKKCWSSVVNSISNSVVEYFGNKDSQYLCGGMKPLFRGSLHEFVSYFIFPVYAYLLFFISDDILSFVSSTILVLSTFSSYFSSYMYHRINWRYVEIEKFIQKIDKACIYFNISGSYSICAILLLPYYKSIPFLCLSWFLCYRGIYNLICKNRDSVVNYLLPGSVICFILPDVISILPTHELYCILMNFVCYILGTYIYVYKKLDIFPHVFGYHEVFHVFITIGGLLTMYVSYNITYRHNFNNNIPIL